jgi:hypothetical protein
VHQDAVVDDLALHIVTQHVFAPVHELDGHLLRGIGSLVLMPQAP